MQVKLIQTLADFMALEDHWNELVEQCSAASIFQTFGLHKAWLLAHGENYSLSIVVIFNDKKLKAIAPLIISKERFNLKSESVLQFIGSPDFAFDYCDFIVADNSLLARKALFDAIFKLKKRWSLIDLKNVPESSENLIALKDYLNEVSSLYELSNFMDAPALLLSDKEALKRAVNKKSLKRHEKGLLKNGSLELKELSGNNQKDELEIFFNQHIARSEYAKRNSLFKESSNRQFYYNLCEELKDDRCLSFTSLTHNQKAIAYHFGFIFRERFYWYKPSFDPKMAKSYPGEVLLKRLIELAVSKSCKEFDFTVGNESFKSRFANHLRHNMRIKVYNRKLSFYLARLRHLLAILLKSKTRCI